MVHFTVTGNSLQLPLLLEEYASKIVLRDKHQRYSTSTVQQIAPKSHLGSDSISRRTVCLLFSLIVCLPEKLNTSLGLWDKKIR